MILIQDKYHELNIIKSRERKNEGKEEEEGKNERKKKK